MITAASTISAVGRPRQAVGEELTGSSTARGLQGCAR
jgi:hypothetical protein